MRQYIFKKKNEFLKSLFERESFICFIERLPNFDKDKKIDLNFDFRFSEYEFQDIPFRFYKLIYEGINFTEIEALNFENWFYVNYEAVKKGIIKPYYFAYTKRDKNGLRNLTKALREYKMGKYDFFEKIFKEVIKKFFGYVKQKKFSSISKNISFAKVWWEYHNVYKRQA